MLRTKSSRRTRRNRLGQNTQQTRRLLFEGMEPRLLLHGTDCGLDWSDTNMDNYVSPVDVLLVVNDLQQNKAHPHEAFDHPNAWPDVNFDGWITPVDALIVVNDLNENGSHPFVLECPPAQGETLVPLGETQPPSSYLLAGSVEDVVLKHGLRAKNGDIDLITIEFSAEGAGADSVDNIRILEAGSGEVLVLATRGQAVGTKADFVAHIVPGDVRIPEDGTMGLQYAPKMLSDEYGAIAGEPVTLSVQTIVGVGVNSGNKITLGVNIESNEHDVVFVEVSEVIDVNPDQDGTQVPLGTDKVIFEGRLTVDPHENTHDGLDKFVGRQVQFIVKRSNVQMDLDGFDLYNKNDVTQKIHGHAAEETPGRIRVVFNADENGLVDLSIGSGESDTWVLAADIVDNQVSSTIGSDLQAAMDLQNLVWAEYHGGPDEVIHSGLRLEYDWVESTQYRI